MVPKAASVRGHVVLDIVNVLVGIVMLDKRALPKRIDDLLGLVGAEEDLDV